MLLIIGCISNYNKSYGVAAGHKGLQPKWPRFFSDSMKEKTFVSFVST